MEYKEGEAMEICIENLEDLNRDTSKDFEGCPWDTKIIQCECGFNLIVNDGKELRCPRCRKLISVQEKDNT